MSEIKLTKPQAELLQSITSAPTSVNASWPPAKKLVGHGFAEWKAGKYTDYLIITDAGRAALARSTQDDGEAR